MAIGYTKLKSGDWGLRGPVVELQKGTVQVVKKSGEVKTEVVAEIVATFPDGNGLATIGKTQSEATRRTPARGFCEHCGDRCNPRYKTCQECSHGGQSFYDRNGNFVLGSDD